MRNEFYEEKVIDDIVVIQGGKNFIIGVSLYFGQV